jgi:hypothetical protein
MRFGYRPCPDVGQKAVVGLAHYWVHRPQVLMAGPAEHVGEHRIGRSESRQRRGQHNRRLDLAQLHQLSGAHELAVAVADEQAGRQRAPPT